ncbi:MAG: TRAP transporter large permease subunit [Dysosmobacter sp.]
MTLILVMIMSIIMGMGMPAVASIYGPGHCHRPRAGGAGNFPTLTAHFFCFYFGIIASITPPVAVPSYAPAAAIAGSNPSSTGWAAFKMAIPAFLIPFVFVYEPGMYFNGGSTINSVICARLHQHRRLLPGGRRYGGLGVPSSDQVEADSAVAGGLYYIIPEHITDLIGVAVLVFLVVSEYHAKKLEQPAVS